MNSKPADSNPDSSEPSERANGTALANSGNSAAHQSIQDERLTASRFVLFFLPAIVGLAADLWTKSWMFSNHFDPARAAAHYPQQPHWWVEGVFGIQTSTNPGALFGLGAGYSWLFAIVSLVALAGVLVWMFVFKGAADRWLAWTVGMITGGILGNLYDRVGWGFVPGWPDAIRTDVRDWILFRLEGIPFFAPWPNFNIADCLLVCGAIMLLIHAFFLVENEKSEPLE